MNRDAKHKYELVIEFKKNPKLTDTLSAYRRMIANGGHVVTTYLVQPRIARRFAFQTLAFPTQQEREDGWLAPLDHRFERRVQRLYEL